MTLTPSKQLLLPWIVLILLFAPAQTARPELIPQGVECTRCKCYAMNCINLKNPDLNCVNKYQDTCDNPADITEDNFCNFACDCCLEGQCHDESSF
jgi:hypothetical protein